MKIRELKRGDFFRLTPQSRKTWVKDEYDHSSKKYLCYNYEDINDFREFDGSKEVFTEFVY